MLGSNFDKLREIHLQTENFDETDFFRADFRGGKNTKVLKTIFVKCKKFLDILLVDTMKNLVLKFYRIQDKNLLKSYCFPFFKVDGRLCAGTSQK